MNNRKRKSHRLKPTGFSLWRAARDFVPHYRAIASLRSLPRRRKQSPGLFSSASFACSLLVRIPCALNTKKEVTHKCVSLLLARCKGFCPVLSHYRLASLVATSAKTVPRTVFFRKLRLLPPCSNPLHFLIQKKKRHTNVYHFFWRAARDSNP